MCDLLTLSFPVSFVKQGCDQVSKCLRNDLLFANNLRDKIKCYAQNSPMESCLAVGVGAAALASAQGRMACSQCQIVITISF